MLMHVVVIDFRRLHSLERQAEAVLWHYGHVGLACVSFGISQVHEHVWDGKLLKCVVCSEALTKRPSAMVILLPEDFEPIYHRPGGLDICSGAVCAACVKGHSFDECRDLIRDGMVKQGLITEEEVVLHEAPNLLQ